MFSVFIIAEESEAVRKLHSGLAQKGFAYFIVSDGKEGFREEA